MEPLRLPGISFETPPQAVPTALPRMDVAAFVGFAATGPLHVPVLIEGAGRFRDLFGAPPELAWDGERGETLRAHLAPTVEAFFANGGRRCWVVRVADETVAVRHRFVLPGLRAPDALADDVCGRARAAGTWCEELAVGTTLVREPLAFHEPGPGDAEAFVLEAGGYRLDLDAEPERFQPGDLLEWTFGPGRLWLYLFVEEVTAAEGATRLTGARLLKDGLQVVETPGAYWFEPAPIASPDDDEAPAEPVPLSETAGLDSAADWLAASPSDGRRPVLRRLSLEISVWRGTELVARLGELAFDRRHPRFWAALPTDEELFRQLLGRRPVSERAGAAGAGGVGSEQEVTVADPGSLKPAGLIADAAEPRFPLAGPPPEEAAERYLPLGVGTARSPFAARSLPSSLSGTPLERDGLGVFAPRLFLDRRLTALPQGSLLTEAEHHYSVRGRRLRGVHSLLPIREASLVSVPDAIHRGWSREAPETTAPLGAPCLDLPGAPDPAGRHPLTWTPLAEATAYRLELDEAPDFPQPVTAYEGPLPTAPVTLPPGCPRIIAFRVQALRHGERGPWSNTVTVRLPRATFAPCTGGPPGALILTLIEPAPPAQRSLSWETEAAATASPPSPPPHPQHPEPPAADRFQIEEAADATFAGARTIHCGGGDHIDLPPLLDGVRYYRVRGLVETRPREQGLEEMLPGPWSNTVVSTARRRAAWTEQPVGAFRDEALLALHRALLRFCSARGDLLALLSLPGHYREEDVRAHVGRLTPGGNDDAPAGGGGSGFPKVPPLTLGEAGVLCSGALHHPWLTVRSTPSGDEASPLTRIPPEGALAGTLAAMALDRGAWLAPANEPLAGVLALVPELAVAHWGRLAAAHVNGLLRRPRGFVALGADTLSPRAACRAIHVRRLLHLLKRLALREGERFVFEPHSAALRDRVRHRFERLLSDLYRRGAFAGTSPEAAFRVRVDGTINPPDAVDRGRLVVELAVAPAPELAYLTVRLVAGPEQVTVEEV